MRLGMKIALSLALTALVGRRAEAQARGTLQATATVVDTRQGFEALSLVRQSVTNSRIESRETVTTVAQVTTARPASQPNTLLVTVDFSRN